MRMMEEMKTPINNHLAFIFNTHIIFSYRQTLRDRQEHGELRL